MCSETTQTDLKEFDGDVTSWGTFWDSFESAIHGNPKLSAINNSGIDNFLKLGGQI